MKTVYLTIMMISAFLMLILPLSAKDNLQGEPTVALPLTQTETPQDEPDKVRLKLTASDTVTEISLEDYIFGVVAAEMPALYEEEALKAQAVAAYTFYVIQKEKNKEQAFDISDDYTVHQSFINADLAREKWGDGADTYENKIRSCVKAVLGQTVLYEGSPATTLYHAISYGVTENAAEVWGGNYPYLVSVDSSWDKLEKNYLYEKTFKAEELKSLLSSLAEVKDLEKNCITDIARTDAGGVKNLKVSGTEISGGDLRQALSLRSSNFEVNFSNGVYTFTTKGYGHSIGMSQYGAHYMAMQGKIYKEILLHYYTGCKVE